MCFRNSIAINSLDIHRFLIIKTYQRNAKPADRSFIYSTAIYVVYGIDIVFAFCLCVFSLTFISLLNLLTIKIENGVNKPSMVEIYAPISILNLKYIEAGDWSPERSFRC